MGAAQIILMVTDRQQQRMDRFGNVAAGTLAQLVVEPLMHQDRMHLGVIGNRLAATPEISGVASYALDDRELASTGDMDGPQYTAPVIIDDNVVGHVRITLDPESFVEGGAGRLSALLVTALLVALAIAIAWSLAGAVRRGDLAASPAHRARPPSAPERGAATDPIADVHQPAPEIRHYLLAVNLYNQLSLPPNEREFEQSLCVELAESVAEIYQGQVVALPGIGTLVDFDHTDDEDRAFDVICAAFTLIRLLSYEAPFGHYRLGLNLTERPADEPLPIDDPAIADAALLSALARDGTLAVSAPFSRAMSDQERLMVQPLVNPLLDELTASSSGCLLVADLQPPFRALVAQQADQLKSQRATISSPSTF